MDIQLDQKFKKINDLKWLPWVGDNYLTIPTNKKLLIIGESHYHLGTEESIKNCEPPDLTREVIEDLAIDQNYYGTRIFQGLYRALFRNDDLDTKKFWALVSFYNFIQRPMETNLGRPTYGDYYSGWTVFFEVYKLLRPKICLFIGTSYTYSFQDVIDEMTDIRADAIKWEDWISNAYAKSSNIYDSDSEKTTLIFIRHTSQMFSWDKWNKYLTNKMGEQLQWLITEIE